MLCVLAGLTVAEHFRDAEGQDVLLFIDNIFRFTQVGSEPCSAAKKCHPFLVFSQQSTFHAVLQDQRSYYCLHFQQCLLACI